MGQRDDIDLDAVPARAQDVPHKLIEFFVHGQLAKDLADGQLSDGQNKFRL